MKICIVSGYPPNVGRGAETTDIYIKELVKYADVEKVTVLCDLVKDLVRKKQNGKVEIARIWSPNSWASIFRVPLEAIHTQADIYHVVYGYLFYGGPLFSTIFILFMLLALKLMRNPTVLTIHQVFSPDEVNKEFKETYLTKVPSFVIKTGFIILNKAIGLLTSRVVALHNWHAHILKEAYGVKQIVCIPIGLTSRATYLKEEAKRILGLSGKNVLLVFGFLTPYKGVEYAVSAMPTILKDVPNSVLIIAGSVMPSISKSPAAWEYVRKLEQGTLEMRKKGHIIMNNSYIPDQLVDLYFSSADVAILPNVKQSGPSEILRTAYLSKIPSVATNVDYFRFDVINSVTGLLVPSKDPEGLAKAVTRILQDESLRSTIIHNLGNFALQSDIKTVTKKLVHLYMQILSQDLRVHYAQ